MPDEEAHAPGVRRPPGLLWAAALGAVGIILLLIIGPLVDGHGPLGFDRAIMAEMRQAGDPASPTGPSWLRPMMVDITALGGATVLTLVTIAAIVLLATRRLWLTAALVAAATISGSWAVTQVKLYVGRPRPDAAGRLIDVSGLSFPSGHAANSAIVYLTIAALATQILHGRATRNAVLIGAVLLVGAIGTSRVYLGVHWPSDVLAGWSFGTLWAGAWWLGAARVRPGFATRVPPAFVPSSARR
ncbi:phosphatase PAP2 family protein [Sphingomonas sp. RS2018]